MMDCAHYRRSLLADPHDPDPALREHRESCRDCSQYTERLLRFESRLERAFGVALPADVDSATLDAAAMTRTAAPRRSPAYRKGWLAMAASVLLAFVVAGALWLSVPGPSLAAAVVTHMREEPDAWRLTDVPVPSPALQDVLRGSHLRLTAGAGVVSYANSCGFRGHQVPHLVIQTESGPVTVMVLVHERSTKQVEFDEQGYRGVIVPVAGHGSLAVLTRGAAVDPKTIEDITRRVLDSIVWTG
jgi:Protein of unknown function (DUF3379)